MAKFGGIDSSKIVQLLIIGAIVMFAVTQIIDIRAFGKGTCSDGVSTSKSVCEDAGGVWTSAEIFREDVEYSGKCSIEGLQDSKSCTAAGGAWTKGLIGNIFVWLLVAMAMFLAWNLVIGGPITRKRMVALLVTGVMLYVLYNYVLAPQLDLAPIEFAAYQLQAMI